MIQKIDIVLGRCPDYRAESLKATLDRGARQALSAINLCGMKVLLKPNLISRHAPALACTEGLLLAAAAEWLIDCGARVAIGDSPAFGQAADVMKKQGISQALSHLDVEVVEFRTARPVTLAHGVQTAIAEEALACDLLVNLPKVKAHNQMFVTMAVKNLFGVVCGMRKAIAHMRNGHSHERFGDLMLDLSEILPRQLVLADCITVMHKEGPVGGEPLWVGCLAVSDDPVGVDTALLQVLELPSHQSPIWRAAASRGIPGSSLENLNFSGMAPDAFHGSGFIAPGTLNPVVFNPLRFITSSIKRVTGVMRG